MYIYIIHTYILRQICRNGCHKLGDFRIGQITEGWPLVIKGFAKKPWPIDI